MNKVLMLASVASMIEQFNMSNIQILEKLGYEVHVSANFEGGNTSSNQRINEFKEELSELGIRYYQVDFSRNITDISSNIKAYKQVKDLMQKNKYEFVHCHSPIGGVIGRIAGHLTKTPVIYTAHGFHFYKGAPLKNWLMFYPIERWLARYTDILITINKEDYTRAKKSFRASRVEYLPGVGINVDKFSKVDINRTQKLQELGLQKDAYVLLSIGEINKNKNHETVIRAISMLNDTNIHYIICGQGSMENKINDLIKELKLENQIKLLGYRKDISEICKVSDIFVFPSFREGLSVALMEAMASGLPVVCSSIRGNIDLIEHEKGGYLVNPQDINGFSKAISEIYVSEKLKSKFREFNLSKIQNYSVENIKNEILNIYQFKNKN